MTAISTPVGDVAMGPKSKPQTSNWTGWASLLIMGSLFLFTVYDRGWGQGERLARIEERIPTKAEKEQSAKDQTDMRNDINLLVNSNVKAEIIMPIIIENQREILDLLNKRVPGRDKRRVNQMKEKLNDAVQKAGPGYKRN